MTGLKSSTFAFIVTLQTPASQPLSASYSPGLVWVKAILSGWKNIGTFFILSIPGNVGSKS